MSDKDNKSLPMIVSVFYILLLTAFGFVLTMTAEMTDAIGGSLDSAGHILFSFLLGFGCLLFGLSRMALISKKMRKVTLIGVSVLYILFMAGVYADIYSFGRVYWLVILCIGYVAGYIYYLVMAEMLQISHGCVVMTVGLALPYFLQFVLQPVVSDERVGLLINVVLFLLVAALLLNPPEFAFGEILPFSENGNDRNVAGISRIRRLVGTAFLMIVALGIVEMSWGADSVDVTIFYKWPRLGIVVAIVLLGIVADRFGWAGVEKLVIISVIFAFAAIYGGSYSGLRLFLFNYCAGIYNAYILLGFWILAPATTHPDVWASGGRFIAMMETGYFYLVRDVSLSGNYLLVLIQALAIALTVGILHSKMEEVYPKAEEGDPFGRFCEKYHFTPRECDVMRVLVSSDDTAKALSAGLNISERMFYRYIKQMCEKVGGVENRNGLVKLYLQQSEKSSEKNNVKFKIKNPETL